MLHLDLFSGIGGFALACQWNGIETIGFVEIDKYCQKVLRKHWLDVPIVEDIRDVERIKEIVANATKSEGSMDRRIISISESGQSRRGNSERDMGCQRNGEHRSGIGKQQSEPQPTILITAGFPCQPFSVARKREGERDDRYLWPQTLAVIKAIKPRWILLENVTGIINLALDTVLSNLEGAGYSYETLIIPACAVNAPHRRDRVWIVAHSEHNRQSRIMGTESIKGRKNASNSKSSSRGEDRPTILSIISHADVAFSESRESWQQTEPKGRQDSGRGSEEVTIADTTEQRLHTEENIGELEGAGGNELDAFKSRNYRGGWWAVEPELGRVAHGIPNRVDRLKCLGNAIVPQVSFEIIKVIKDLELV